MSKRKLLLADDSVTIQKVVNLTFADEGIEVISVGDGNSAMDKIREETPDLIMADVNMPGLNGYEICEKVREIEEDERTPIILLVGSFEPFDEAEAKRVGADDHLTKPFQSINQLVNTVTVLLNSEGFKENVSEDGQAEEPALASSDEGAAMAMPETGFSDTPIDDELIQTDQVGVGSDYDATLEETIESTEEFPAGDDNEAIESESSEDAESSHDEDLKEYTFAESESESESEGFDEEGDRNSEDDSVEYTDYSDSDEESEKTETEFDDGEPEGESFGSETDEYTHGDVDPKVRLDEKNLLELPLKKKHLLSGSSNKIGDESGDEYDKDLDEAVPTAVSDTEGQIDVERNESNADELDQEQRISYSEQDFETIEEESSPDKGLADQADEEIGQDRSASESALSPSVIDEITKKVSENLAVNSSNLGENQESHENAVPSGTIDEISRRVLEQLSDKVVKEVAWEVVPRVADRIVREIAEKKMNE